MRLSLFLALVTALAMTTACKKKEADSTEGGGSSSSSRYLYVAAGVCVGGNGVTTFSATTASNMVYRVNLSNGQRDMVLADYWAVGASPGIDTPVGIADWGDSAVMVLVTSGASGRLEVVPKSPWASRSTFNLSPSNATVLASAPRSLLKTSDGGFMIARSGAIERVSSSGVRIGGAAYIAANLGATCGAANTTYSNIVTTPTKILTTISMTTTSARTATVPAAGATGSCTAAQAVPGGATTWPTSIIYDSANSKMIIAYAGNGIAANVNSIVAYDYNDTTGVMSNAQTIYDSSAYPATYPYLLYAITSMVLDSGTLYVATGNTNTANIVTSNANYAIEKFTYTPSLIGTSNSSVLTRVTSNGQPFYNYGSDTKCVSQMIISN